MWTVFKVRGLLSAEVPFPLTELQSGQATVHVLLLAIKNGYNVSDNKEKRKQQRDAAMMEAFRSLPTADLVQLQTFVQPDCELFDYDCTLARFDHTENGASVHSNYSYFKDWQ